MRIVAGHLKGRRLATPSSLAIRPTSDRVRESLFNILSHGIDAFTLEGAAVLDLFAGTGALGIEALSRGARHAVLVDTSAEARALIRENVEAFGLSGVTKIFKRDATDLGPAQRLGPFDLVFLDPPYGQGLGAQALASALAGGWLAPAALAVLEESIDAELSPMPGFTVWDRRRWGETQMLFLLRNANAR